MGNNRAGQTDPIVEAMILTSRYVLVLRQLKVPAWGKKRKRQTGQAKKTGPPRGGGGEKAATDLILVLAAAKQSWKKIRSRDCRLGESSC